MAIQFAPIAGLALRYGAVALATYAATRSLSSGRLDQNVEDAMDHLPEGASFRKSDGQVNGAARWTRVYRFGQSGKAIKIDATGLARIKVTRVP